MDKKKQRAPSTTNNINKSCIRYSLTGNFLNMIVDNKRWQQAIQWIEKRIANIKIIIGGHGEILSLDDLKSFNTKISAKSPPE